MNSEQHLIDAWLTASRELGVDVVAPFWLVTDAGERYSYVAYLPHFGSPRGILVAALPADLPSDPALERAAKSQGYICSFVADIYREFDRPLFVETLVDWGFFGAKDQRPAWLELPHDV